MAKYRKKPVVIEAEQWHGGDPPLSGMVLDEDGNYVIETLEGKMRVRDGDWRLIGVEGEKYPCKDSVFQKTYEAVEETDDGK